MTGREYARTLREVAEFFDKYPDLMIPDPHRTIPIFYETTGPEIEQVRLIGEQEQFEPELAATGEILLLVKELANSSICFALPHAGKPN